MRHDDAERLIACLALGGLEGEERQAVETHAAQCEACRQALADLRATCSLLAEAVAALPREELGADRRQAVLAAVLKAGEPAVPPAVASGLPPPETLIPAGGAASVPPARPMSRRPRRLLWLGVGIAAGLVLCGLLLPALSGARFKRRSAWEGARFGLARPSAAVAYDSPKPTCAALEPSSPALAKSVPAAGGPGMMGGAGGMPGGMSGGGLGMPGGMMGGGAGMSGGAGGMMGPGGIAMGGMPGGGAIAPETFFDANGADKGTALAAPYDSGSGTVVGQPGDRRVAEKTAETRWRWSEPAKPAAKKAGEGAAVSTFSDAGTQAGNEVPGSLGREERLERARLLRERPRPSPSTPRPEVRHDEAMPGLADASHGTQADAEAGEQSRRKAEVRPGPLGMAAGGEGLAEQAAAATEVEPRFQLGGETVQAWDSLADGKANAPSAGAGLQAESAPDAYRAVVAGKDGWAAAERDSVEVDFGRSKVLTDSLAVTTSPAPGVPAAPPPSVENFQLGIAKEAKADAAGADRKGPQEPALLPASETIVLYSKLDRGQAAQAGDLDQIQFAAAADSAAALPDLQAVQTAPLLGDLPAQGRLAGIEGARPEAESTDAATLGHAAATVVDPFGTVAAGTKIAARKAAGEDAAAKQESAARSSRNAEESKRKVRSSREQAVLTPEAAARGLVEENETLAPAKKQQLLEVLRQNQVATLTHQERPLSDEELAAPPAAPPGPVNPFVMTEKDRFSTFALEAESASYALARRYIANRRLPPPGLIRMEEFVNAFDYAYPVQSTRTFAIHAEAGPAPFGKDLTLLKIGVKAKVLGRDGRKPAHLVFVIDASGSMGREDRLPLVQFALGLMAMQLDPRDRLSLVTYDTQARLLLEAVPAARAEEIQAAVGALATGATTNLQAGIELGYQIAARHFRSGETNRVILCSDGVANVGPADAAAILAKVDQYRRQGITLTSVGVGSGSYDDRMLEQLANRGDGNYVFVDSPEQARRVFVDDFAGTLQMVARNAKIQVEFNPLRVRRYRLIGYENRDVADKDFRNDAVDAGEIGSGQAATALYELELLPAAGDTAVSPDLGTVYVRYENVDSGRVEEISSRLSTLILQGRTPDRDPRLFLAACAAEFAEILRESEHARDGSLQALEGAAIRVANALPLDQRAQELLTLVRRAEGLPR